jgi:hypothetical protein
MGKWMDGKGRGCWGRGNLKWFGGIWDGRSGYGRGMGIWAEDGGERGSYGLNFVSDGDRAGVQTGEGVLLAGMWEVLSH